MTPHPLPPFPVGEASVVGRVGRQRISRPYTAGFGTLCYSTRLSRGSSGAPAHIETPIVRVSVRRATQPAYPVGRVGRQRISRPYTAGFGTLRYSTRLSRGSSRAPVHIETLYGGFRYAVLLNPPIPWVE
jgi:hypothetical protein